MKTALALSWLYAAVLLTACGEETKKEAAAPTINPGQIVQFAKGVGCVTKDSYNKVAQQSVNAEKTSSGALAMPPDCVKLPQKTDFRVISVDPRSDNSLIEVTNSHNVGTSGGIWTTSEFVVQKTEPEGAGGAPAGSVR